MEKNELNTVTLLLFTELFPYGINSEQAFLINEINYLTDAFKKVIIFPHSGRGEQTTTGSFTIDLSLDNILHERSKPGMVLSAMKQTLLYKEFFAKNIFFWNSFRLRRLIYCLARYSLVKNWFLNYLDVNNLLSSRVLVYTYWNDEITAGLLGCKSHLRNTRFISRAHGHDLFENYWDYLPCQGYNVKYLDRLFLVSRAALNYTKDKYPDSGDKLSLSHLGVNAAKKYTEKSIDGILRIVSCSYVVRLKQIDLIIRSIAEYSKKYHQKVEWTHIGDGIQMEEIKSLAESNRSELFTYCFKGFIPNDEVLENYRESPFDLFIHLSESEGGVPVAIQEAIAHGIPVIATNTGGIYEAVNSETGKLLKDHPGIGEIAEAIHQVVSDNKKFEIMRNKCVLHWKNYFDEKRNFSEYASELCNLFT
jgi:colanic acid/amylovoran biosynthesis glycosyltransferase